MEEFIEITEEINEEPMKTVNEEEIQEKAIEAGVYFEEGRKRKRWALELKVLYLMKLTK